LDVSMAVSISKRKVKVSKNRKKSWNKFCDVKEVEDYLEEKRFDERIGGRISEKPDEELFFVQKEIEKPAKTKKISRPLRCFQSIGAFSCVPPPVNVEVNRYPKRIQSSIYRNEKKKDKKLLNQKPKQKHAEILQWGNSKLEFKDLWEDEKIEEDSDIRELVTFRDEYTKKRTPKVPSHRYQKPTLLPAVELPHPGSSYNPRPEDHQALLLEAAHVEEKKLRQELHLKRVLDDMFPSKKDAPTQESIMLEMSQGLFEEGDEEEEAEAANNFMLRNPPVCAEDRLPKSRKRRRKEAKEGAKRKAKEKLDKKRLNEIDRIPSLKKEIKKENKLSEQKQEKKLQRKVEKLYQPKTLSAHKYQAPDIEVNLTEEITGVMRTLKTDGNLMEDRYKSFQRRNLIEPRIRQKMKRKYKLKTQIKRSHRDFEGLSHLDLLNKA